MGAFGVLAGQRIGPVGDGEKVELDLEGPPDRPEEREGGEDEPHKDKPVDQELQAKGAFAC